MRAFLLGFAVLAACSSISTSYDFDPDADFSGLKTYAWFDPEVDPTADLSEGSPLVRKRVRRAVEARLDALGFTRVDRDADFHLVVHLEARQRVRSTPSVHAGYGSRRGYSYWGASSSEVEVYDEGSIILDVVDRRKKQLMWRGVARSAIPSNPKPEKITKIVDEACEKLVALFPPPAR